MKGIILLSIVFVCGCEVYGPDYEYKYDAVPNPPRKSNAIDRRTKYIYDHPELSEKLKDCIITGKIILGMTKEQVIASWGQPYDINRSVYSFGIHEQWIYGEYESTYLYFINGILDSWQD